MILKKRKQAPGPLSRGAVRLLVDTPGLWNLNDEERYEMSVSCRDTDYIKKVKEAGIVKKVNDQEVQVMHNGILVENGGYHGNWMSRIITELNGHHEPQEEVGFYEVLKRLHSGASMVELGSFWSYYSIWFNKQIKDAKNIACEPDPANLALGKRNAKLNNTNINFIQSAAGEHDHAIMDFSLESKPGETSKVEVRTVDSIIAESGWDRLDVLHMDVQGYEYQALKGAQTTITAGKIRFLFVSTHHYVFSGNPNTHADCVDLIKKNGGNIIMSHTIAESYSGDGLIIASFSEEDKDFTIKGSLNHTDKSLFRPYEKDIALLVEAYDQLNG